MVALHDHSILLLLAYLTATINAVTYDLANPITAERFYANSNINVTYDEDSNAITWTAQTPLAVGCGVSVLVASEIVGKFFRIILKLSLLIVNISSVLSHRCISMATHLFGHDGSICTHD